MGVTLTKSGRMEEWQEVQVNCGPGFNRTTCELYRARLVKPSPTGLGNYDARPLRKAMSVH